MITKLNEKYGKGDLDDIVLMTVFGLLLTPIVGVFGMMMAYGLTFGHINLFAYLEPEIIFSFASYGAVFGAILGYFWGSEKEEK